MAEFLEDLLYTTIKYGSSWQDDYAVNVVTTSGGQEYRSLTNEILEHENEIGKIRVLMAKETEKIEDINTLPEGAILGLYKLLQKSK